MVCMSINSVTHLALKGSSVQAEFIKRDERGGNITELKEMKILKE